MSNLIERVRVRIPDTCPLVVAGDFNDWQQKFSNPLENELGLRECGVDFTGCSMQRPFPSWRPFLRTGPRLYS